MSLWHAKILLIVLSYCRSSVHLCSVLLLPSRLSTIVTALLPVSIPIGAALFLAAWFRSFFALCSQLISNRRSLFRWDGSLNIIVLLVLLLSIISINLFWSISMGVGRLVALLVFLLGLGVLYLLPIYRAIS
jgi:hypothetical protein